jgi:acetyl-CoA synthetase
MLLYFTSGTSGQPKMVTHNYTYPLGHITTARFWQNLHPASLHFTVADSGWAKAVWGKIFGQWLCEAAIFVYDHDNFDARKLLEVISQYKITSFCAPPTIYRYLARAGIKDYDLSALEHLTTAGEPLNPDVSQKFKELTGLDIYEGFGQTETTPVIFTNIYMKPCNGYLGHATPACKVGLLNSENIPVQNGDIGEICVFTKPGETPGIFTGYYKSQTQTENAWENGIYHTGDLAVMDENGYYRFVGRDDDVIKASSYRIGPFEVESVLFEHAAVSECAVTGVPDKQRGQAVKASIVLAKGYAPSDDLVRELQQFVKDNTASYKCPRFIEFVPSLPKTISNKIKRAEIRNSENT